MGTIELDLGDRKITRFRTAKTATLLAYLAVHAGRSIQRSDLLDLLWPDHDPEQARNSLSQSLSSIRNQLEPIGVEHGAVLNADRHTVTLDANAVTTDVSELLAAVKRTRIQSDAHGPAWFEHQRVLEIYGGEFSPGRFDPWTIGQREEYRNMALASADSCIDGHLRQGEIAAALELARRACLWDQLDERRHQKVIQLCLQIQDWEGAKNQYRILSQVFSSQLGLKPSESTKELLRSVQIESPTIEPIPEHTPTSSEVKAVGGLQVFLAIRPVAADGIEGNVEYHYGPSLNEVFKHHRQVVESRASAALTLAEWAQSVPNEVQPGTQEAVELLELLDGPGFIASESAAAALRSHTGDGTQIKRLQSFRAASGENKLAFAVLLEGMEDQVPKLKRGPAILDLPVRATSFVGREEEVHSLIEAFKSGRSRLFTLTGPGGIGKTRLSVEVARKFVEETGARAVFVDLATARTSEQLLGAIRTALKLPESSGTALEDLAANLTDTPLLLILDNFEQLIEVDGTDQSAAPLLVQRLLEATATLQVLVTSRRKLNIDFEEESVLSPLSLPGEASDHPEESDAVRLFIDRARRARPDFSSSPAQLEAIVKICNLLDGLPLAIELTASRAQTLSPKQLLERLDNALDFAGRTRTLPERQRTLRNTIEWSYSLLSSRLRRAFEDLAVFPASWGLQAVDAIWETPSPEDDLADLREFSLVTSASGELEEPRFRLLDTIRTFAAEKLHDARRTQLHQKLLEWCLTLAQSADGQFVGENQRHWLSRLENEHANLISSLQFAIETHQTEVAATLCSLLWRHWHIRGHLTEGRAFMEQVSHLEDWADLNDSLKMKSLHGVGRLAYLQGDYEVAEGVHLQALELAKKTKTLSAIADAEIALGSIAYERGDYAQAKSYYASCLEMRKQLEDDFGSAACLNWIGIVYTDEGDYDLARQTLSESLTIRRKISDDGGIARSLNSLAIIARQTGDFELALDTFQQALKIQLELGDVRAAAGIYSNLGLVSLNLERLDAAGEYFEHALELSIKAGDQWGRATVLANLGALNCRLRRLPEAWNLLTQSLRVRFQIQNLWGVAYSFEGLAELLALQGDHAVAYRLVIAANDLRGKIGSPLPPTEKEQWKILSHSIEQVLSDDEKAQIVETTLAAGTDYWVHRILDSPTTSQIR